MNILVGGVARNLSAIDNQIIHFSQNWRMNRMAVIDRNILRLATFELLFLEDIPVLQAQEFQKEHILKMLILLLLRLLQEQETPFVVLLMLM